jgi:2-keto-4-pentenoate hydratase
VHSGAGVEVMGDPVNAVVWLANKLAEHNTHLKAGDIVLSGAITASVPVDKGDCMNICFSELGNIEVKFN